MMKPTGCLLWRDPEPLVTGPLNQSFELLETFVKESHWWRSLLGCRECGQQYFFEFHEEVDWVDGEDPQFSTWVPVATQQDLETLKAAGALDLRGFRPHLRKDWPKGAERRVYWVKDDELS